MDYAATILSKLPGAGKRGHGVRRLIETLQSYLPDEQLAQITAAYEFGAEAHLGQKRKTGEAYITHPVAVAQELAEMHLDAQAITAAILHDTVEDTSATALRSMIWSNSSMMSRRLISRTFRFPNAGIASYSSVIFTSAQRLR